MPRVSAFFAASVFALLAGCSGGSPSSLVPRNDAPSLSLKNAAVTEAVLHAFAGGKADGATPISGLTALGNLFYGTTGGGGTKGKGTVFSIKPDGTGFTVLYSFTGKQSGSNLPSELTNVGGTLYGSTRYGGAAGNGTVFSITPAGVFTTLYSFKGGRTDGAHPSAALTNVRGTLYGTTFDGGSNVGPGGCTNCGTVFSISTTGKERVLYFFGSKAGDGTAPQSALVLARAKLYGTTTSGGSGGTLGDGTIFSITVRGKEAVIYKFRGKSDGDCAFNCWLTSVAGTLYGTAYHGGKNHAGSIFSVTRGGAFKTLYSASTAGNVGGEPKAALTNVAGTLYGTMSAGPVGKNNGTAFSITATGMLKLLYTFSGGNDGSRPSSSFAFAGGKLFGATDRGGSSDAGTIYSLSGF